jgi:hypothetical protein
VVLLICLVLWYAKNGNVRNYRANPHCAVITGDIHDGHTLLFNFELICLCLFIWFFGLLFNLPLLYFTLLYFTLLYFTFLLFSSLLFSSLLFSSPPPWVAFHLS